jgi:hypothetical protein
MHLEEMADEDLEVSKRKKHKQMMLIDDEVEWKG